MNRSPGCSTRRSGTKVHVASSVSPRAWCSSNVSSPRVNVRCCRVGDIGVAVLARPGELRHVDRELAPVDRRVPADRLLVATEVGGQVLVGVDHRTLPPLVGRFGVEQCRAEHVVDVVVRVHRSTHRCIGSPATDHVVHGSAVERPTGVEHHQAVAGVERIHRGDRLQREQALVDLLAGRASRAVVMMHVDRLHRMMGVDEFAPPLPVLLGEFPDRGHDANLGCDPGATSPRVPIDRRADPVGPGCGGPVRLRR